MFSVGLSGCFTREILGGSASGARATRPRVVAALQPAPDRIALRAPLRRLPSSPPKLIPAHPRNQPNGETIMAKKTTKSASDVTRYTAYSVREFERNGETDRDWMRIGVAFPHEDGKGFNLALHAVPVDGKVVLRLFEPRDESPQN
jgi:hypothetical protein